MVRLSAQQLVRPTEVGLMAAGDGNTLFQCKLADLVRLLQPPTTIHASDMPLMILSEQPIYMPPTYGKEKMQPSCYF